MLLALAQLPDSTIRHAVIDVFRDPAFSRLSLWQRFLGWLVDVGRRGYALLDSLLSSLHQSPPLYWTVIGLLVVLLLAILGRVAYLWYLRSTAGADALRGESAAGGHGGRDPWTAAQELAARGEFTEAAHALYAALLQAAARQQQVRLHPSKTVGDYVRELRARSSSLFLRFRDFARSYEVVIYGIGSCDEARYQRLHALAAPIVRPHG